MNEPSLRVIPLGGLGEIGRNMMAFEFDRDIVVVDAGVLFPEEDMPGVDFVIPDVSYLVENREFVRAILITHGHEDHIGALPWILPDLDVPVYAPRLAHGLITVKLRERGVLRQARLNVIEPHSPFRLGNFSVEFFRVCHSIPDAMGIALRTPAGMAVHTGDFKIDHTPVDGLPTDFAALAELTSEGVLLMCSDSTYAEVEGYTSSEQVVGETLMRVIGDAKGRVIVSSFASLISRIQQVINAAATHNRKVTVVGRSMVNNVKMALNMGYLTDPGDVVVPIRHSRQLPHEQVVIMATGSQGEPTSALVRMAKGEHQDIEVIPGDTVVISASPIPGNETLVARTIDNLYRKGAKVFYSRTANVHVHGHASREELKMMLGLVRPKYFVPVHGEYRHQVAHAALAQSMGIPEHNTFVLDNGDVLELNQEHGEIVDSVPAGRIYVDGNRLWRSNDEVLAERRRLSRDGVVVVTVTFDAETGEVIGQPQVASSGFSTRAESSDLFNTISKNVLTLLDDDLTIASDWETVKSSVTRTVADYLQKQTRRRPTVLVVMEEV